MDTLKTRKETASTLILVFSFIITLITAAILGAALTAPASAQEVPTETDSNVTETPTPEEAGDGWETIEPGLEAKATYLPGEGAVRLKLRAETPRSVTLTDAGAVREGGEVPRRTFIATRGVSTHRFSVTEVDGLAAITIGTPKTLYAIVLEDTGGLLDVPAPDDRAALLIGIALPPALGYLWVRRRQSLDDKGVVSVE